MACSSQAWAIDHQQQTLVAPHAQLYNSIIEEVPVKQSFIFVYNASMWFAHASMWRYRQFLQRGNIEPIQNALCSLKPEKAIQSMP